MRKQKGQADTAPAGKKKTQAENKQQQKNGNVVPGLRGGGGLVLQAQTEIQNFARAPAVREFRLRNSEDRSRVTFSLPFKTAAKITRTLTLEKSL